MSRHIIANAPGSPPGRETTVRWDASLGTFLAMAFDPPESGELDDDEVEVFWHGAEPRGIRSIQQLARILDGEGVDLPAYIAGRLVEDQQREGDRSQGRPGTPLVEALADRAGEL